MEINELLELFKTDDILDISKWPLNSLDTNNSLTICSNLVKLFMNLSYSKTHKDILIRSIKFMFTGIIISNIEVQNVIIRFISLIYSELLKEKPDRDIINAIKWKELLDFLMDQKTPETVINVLCSNLFIDIPLDEIEGIFDETFKRSIPVQTCLFDLYTNSLFLYDDSGLIKILTIILSKKESFQEYFDAFIVSAVSLLESNDARKMIINKIKDEGLYKILLILPYPEAKDALMKMIINQDSVSLEIIFAAIMKIKTVDEFVAFLNLSENLTTPMMLKYYFEYEGKFMFNLKAIKPNWEKIVHSDELLLILYKQSLSFDICSFILNDFFSNRTQDPSLYLLLLIERINIITTNKQLSPIMLAYILVILMSTNSDVTTTTCILFNNHINDVSNFEEIFNHILSFVRNTEYKSKAYEMLYITLKRQYDDFGPHLLCITPHKKKKLINPVTIDYVFQNKHFSFTAQANDTIGKFKVYISFKHKVNLSDFSLSDAATQANLNSNEQLNDHRSLLVSITSYTPFIETNLMKLTHLLTRGALIFNISADLKNDVFYAFLLLELLPSINCRNAAQSFLRATGKFERLYYLEYICYNFSDDGYNAVVSKYDALSSVLMMKKYYYKIVTQKNDDIPLPREVIFNDIVQLKSRKITRKCLPYVAELGATKLWELFSILDMKCVEPFTEFFESCSEKKKYFDVFTSHFCIKEEKIGPLSEIICSLITKDSDISSLEKLCITYLKESTIEIKHYSARIILKIISLFPKEIQNFIDLAQIIVLESISTPYYKTYFPIISALAKESDDVRAIVIKTFSPKIHKLNAQTCVYTNQPGGLINYGATCYINSTIRTLITCKPFVDILLQEKLTQPWQIALQDIVGQLELTQTGPVQTFDFCSKFKFFGEKINLREQEDAAEFMQQLINDLPKSIQDLFCGKFKHHIVGLEQQYEKSIEEDFTILSLPANESIPVSKLIQQFSFGEVIKDFGIDNNAKIDVKRMTLIEKSPPFLLVSLKRFQYDMLDHKRKKLSTHINIDYSLKAPDKYKLCACLCHFGTAEFGHFYVCVPDENYNSWTKYNDTVIEKIKSIPIEQVYIAVYKKNDVKNKLTVTMNMLSMDLQTKIKNASSSLYAEMFMKSKEMLSIAKYMPLDKMFSYLFDIAYYSFDADDVQDYAEEVFERASEDDLFEYACKWMCANKEKIVDVFYSIDDAHKSQMTDLIIAVIVAWDGTTMKPFVMHLVQCFKADFNLTCLNNIGKIVVEFLSSATNVDHNDLRAMLISFVHPIAKNIIDKGGSGEQPSLPDAIHAITELIDAVDKNIASILNTVCNILAENVDNFDEISQLLIKLKEKGYDVK